MAYQYAAVEQQDTDNLENKEIMSGKWLNPFMSAIRALKAFQRRHKTHDVQIT